MIETTVELVKELFELYRGLPNKHQIVRNNSENTINDAYPLAILMLNQLIQRTLGYRMTDADIDKRREYKVFFTSRKTLLNEFNHFEGYMNIFQPAIDIEAEALQREINSIESKLQQLRSDYTNI